MHFYTVTSLTKYFIFKKYFYPNYERKEMIPFFRIVNIWYSPLETYKSFLDMKFCVGEVIMWEGMYLYVSFIQISTRSVIPWNVWEYCECDFIKHFGKVSINYIYEKKEVSANYSLFFSINLINTLRRWTPLVSPQAN